MNICLYGASSSVLDQSYLDAAERMGALLALHGHAMIFGGGANGVMGAAARGAHKNGGTIIGVAPSFFNVDGILYENCTEFVYTETMRQRKGIMDERADGFILAPGGIGSFEEFFEILTLKQLSRHNRPIAVLNTNGYYQSLQSMMEHCVSERFATKACLDLYRLCDTPEDVIAYLEGYRAGQMDIHKLKHI